MDNMFPSYASMFILGALVGALIMGLWMQTMIARLNKLVQYQNNDNRALLNHYDKMTAERDAYREALNKTHKANNKGK